jgi:organic hydroperoxide reductase OsmC/OhrA
MMGTRATLLAGKKIATPEDRYCANVEGVIENVNGVLKITRIGVTYQLKIPPDKTAEAREAFANYITRCPAAQSVIGCIKIEDELVIEEMPQP